MDAVATINDENEIDLPSSHSDLFHLFCAYALGGLTPDIGKRFLP